MSLHAGPGRKGGRSCDSCHRRKVRCDKKSPCSPCARGGYSCEYPQARTTARRPRKTTITDIASRIRDLERTIIATSGDATPPLRVSTAVSEPGCSRPGPGPAATEGPPTKTRDDILLNRGSSSQYFNEILLSRVIEREHDVQSALASPSSPSSQPTSNCPLNPMGILSAQSFDRPLSSYHPPKPLAQQLWKAFLENFDSCTKVIHVPTTEVLVYTTIDDPARASLEALALCYSIYYAAEITLEGSEDPHALSDGQLSKLRQYKTGLEQAFAHGNFLENPTLTMLHALAIYMSALRVWNSGRSIWTLNGLAIRAAQLIGLHQDGKRLGLPPFESEIRRRLWWYFLQRDGRAAEDYGLQNSHHLHANSGVDPPRNLDDADLYPGMKELPPSRSGWTRMSNILISIVFAEYWGKLAQFGAYVSDIPEEVTRAQLVDELKSKIETLLEGCNIVIPTQRLTIKTAWFIFRKLNLITRQQWLAAHHPEDRESFATEENLLEALKVLDSAWSIYVDELLAPFSWNMRSYPQYHMLLYVLWHLCVRPQGPSAERAWAMVDRFFENAKVSRVGLGQGLKWTVLVAMKEKATSIRRQPRGHYSAEHGNSHDASARPTDSTEAAAAEDIHPELRGDDGGMDWNAALQTMPDWGTMMQEFQLQFLDECDFTMG